MLRASTRLTAVALLTTGLLMLAEPAQAALWLDISPSSAVPGTSVSGRTIGNGSLQLVGATALPAWLVNAELWKRHESIAGSTSIGELTPDRKSNGRVSFVVPEVRPGNYLVVVQCDACASHSGWRTTFPVGEFVVRDPNRPLAGAVAAASDGPMTVGVLAIGGALVLAIAFGLIRFKNRERVRAPEHERV